MSKCISNRLTLICAVAFGLCALTGMGSEGLSGKSEGEGTTAIQDGMILSKDFVALLSIRLNRTDLGNFRELVKKFDEWSKIVVANKLEGINKPLASGKLAAMFVSQQGEDNDGKPVIRCFLSLQGTDLGSEELHGIIKSLDLIPDLDQRIEKADRMLK